MERSLTAEPTKEATIWIKLHHGAEVKIKAQSSDWNRPVQSTEGRQTVPLAGLPAGQAKRRQSLMPGGVGGVTGAILSPPPDSASSFSFGKWGGFKGIGTIYRVVSATPLSMSLTSKSLFFRQTAQIPGDLKRMPTKQGPSVVRIVD
jgi:hypothetical protein